MIGAGPVGLEAALLGAELGHDVRVYERGEVGQHLGRWGFVRLFSPWSMNHSPLGARALREAGAALPADDAFLTGAEHQKRYLGPLARSPLLAGRVHERHAVAAVARRGIGKGRPFGEARSHHPFRLLLDTPEGERTAEADVVIDASGVYGTPGWLGDGGAPVPGERALRGRLDTALPDVAGVERARFAGARVVVVGSGYSAATALDSLAAAGALSVDWIVRSDRDPLYEVRDDDPLPERRRLGLLANRLAAGAETRVRCHRGSVVEALAEAGDGAVEVVLRGGRGVNRLCADRLLSLVGYGPDSSLYRELQIHECYASSGPMKLAASLLAAEGAGGDCLAQRSHGPETLENPEPDFYIVGAKSYGRGSQFLVRVGLDQVREIYTLIGGRCASELGSATALPRASAEGSSR